MKIHFVSLGCPKNLVDHQKRARYLIEERAAEPVDDPARAEIILINSCAFTASAREESIARILQMARHKERDPSVRLIVSGCLGQWSKDELSAALPEVDLIVGVDETNRELFDNPIFSAPSGKSARFDPELTGLRSGEPFAYLKIAEGCSRACSFCLIPQIRGEYRSRDFDAIVSEARELADSGARELIVIAQETSRYGFDRACDGVDLVDLLRALEKIDGIRWIRTLYNHPGTMTDRLIDLIGDSEKITPYIDMPIQHISDSILRRMGRAEKSSAIFRLIEKIRDRIDGVAIRTSLIVGFPGETESDYRELEEAIARIEFDHLGVFRYSDETDAPSARLDGKVPPEVALERWHRLMSIQRSISEKIARGKIGRRFEALIDGYDSESFLHRGRIATQAPEIDGSIIFDRVDGAIGAFVEIEITDIADPYDLIGAPPGLKRS